MERFAVYQIEQSGINAEVVVGQSESGITIVVKVGGKKLVESNLGNAEIEALRRFFTE